MGRGRNRSPMVENKRGKIRGANQLIDNSGVVCASYIMHG